MSLDCWLLTLLPSFLPLGASFLSFVFLICHFLSLFSLQPFCPGVLLPPACRDKIFAPQSLSQGSTMSAPQETPSHLLRGIQKATFLAFPVLNELSFPALAWPRMLNTPSFCSALPCVWLSAQRCSQCHPCLQTLGCSPARQSRGKRKHKATNLQHHEAEWNSLN